MTNEYHSLQSGPLTKWLGSSIQYTFIQSLPDYYFNTDFASWYSNEVNTTEGFTTFDDKQEQAIFYLLESPDSTKISGNYISEVDYRVSYPDVINFSFSEQYQSGNSVGNITFLNATLLAPEGEDAIGFFPDTYGIGSQEKGDIIVDQISEVNKDTNLGSP